MMKVLIGKFFKLLPIIVVGGTFLWAALTVNTRRTHKTTDDVIVLGIAHWQLEAGVRDAFNELAAEYQKTHPNVRIEQNAIPETGYGRWVSTQLLGGIAPDIIEVGLGLPRNIWVSYFNRYFIPLTEHLQKPNPYNKGTDLETVPTRLTCYDGMRTAYVEELQEYMSIPLSQFGLRIFYNKTLLKKLTGIDEVPADYQQFKKICQQITSVIDKKGYPYIPIASSKYHLPGWESYLIDSVTPPLIDKIDFNRDSAVSNTEMFVAVKSGKITMADPILKARFQMLREITNFFQPGWMGLGRDEAVFLFAQQKAVFILTGTWDAMSLIDQAKGLFEIGVMDFPIPKKDDPQYGQFVRGQLYEIPIVGFRFGVTRTSKHPEVALDFLLFLAGRQINEKLNRIIGWIPSTIGAEVMPMLKAFKPHLDGAYPGFNSSRMNLGGETWIKWMQTYSSFNVGKINYDQLVAEFEPSYKTDGMKDFFEQQRDWRRAMIKNERFIASIRANALLASAESPIEGNIKWLKYTNMISVRQVNPEINQKYGLRMVTEPEKTIFTDEGPYEYSPEVIAKIKKRVVESLSE